MCSVARLLRLVLLPGYFAFPLPAWALSCLDDASQVERADAVFSAIPMKAEVLADQKVAIFQVDVYRVWKGHVQVQETVSVILQRAFILGDEVVIAANRDEAGRFSVGRCELARDTWREPDWVENTLGAPEFEFVPDLFSAPVPQ